MIWRKLSRLAWNFDPRQEKLQRTWRKFHLDVNITNSHWTQFGEFKRNQFKKKHNLFVILNAIFSLLSLVFVAPIGQTFSTRITAALYSGLTVILVTSWCWWLKLVDNLLTIGVRRSYKKIMKFDDKNGENRHQHISSPTSVTNIDVTIFRL